MDNTPLTSNETRIITALREGRVRVVPAEATPGMIRAAYTVLDYADQRNEDLDVCEMWRVMLAATPDEI